MTVTALDVLQDATWGQRHIDGDCPVCEAMEYLDALVQAAQPGDERFERAEMRWMSMENATIEVPARWLAELGRARARVTGEAR